MPKIIKTSDQENALKTIVSDIKVLTGINAVLGQGGQAATITITAGKTKAVIPAEKDTADSILADIRKKLVSEVKSLSKKYAIALDESDEAVLANRTETKKAEAISKTETAPVAEESEVDEAVDEDETVDPVDPEESDETEDREVVSGYGYDRNY